MVKERRFSHYFGHVIPGDLAWTSAPTLYRALGCLPAEQFVPQLMEHLGQPYYVGLLAAPLAQYVAGHAKEYVPLRPRKSIALAARNIRWRLLVNEDVEADL